MALQVQNKEVFNTGIILNTAYAKITGVSYNASNNDCFIHVEYFENKQAADTRKASIGQYTNSFTVADPNGNLRQQAYEYLKTLPLFENAIDILEE
jgi:hypothetical protein